MATLIVFIIFMGFFLLYNTSKKADLNRSFFLEKIAQDNPKPSKITGVLLMLIALAGSILHWGTGSGIFAFFVILMTVGSAVVLIAPLRYVNYKFISGMFLFFLMLEILVG